MSVFEHTLIMTLDFIQTTFMLVGTLVIACKISFHVNKAIARYKS